MNYVGQLAGSVLGRVRDLYKGVNPATLSGSIDVIVVQQSDGSLRSSPFHVRFGKLGILRSAEMAVDIEVNGEPVDLQMRLGENGEAFFIQEMEEDEERNPPVTPIPRGLDLLSTHVSIDITEDPPAADSTLSTLDRRQRWSNRRKRSRGDEISGAQDRDGIGVLPSYDSVYFSFSDPPEEPSPSQCKDFHTYSEEDLLQLSTSSRSSSPKSDSELEVKILNTPLPENCMEWNWGRLPQVTRSDTGSQMSQSAPPSPTRELVEISSATSADPELLHATQEDDGTFRIVLLEGSGDAPELQVPPEAPSASLKFSPYEALSPDSEEVSLYFPNSEPHPPPPPLYQNPEKVEDDIVRSPMSCVALSLCGGLADSWNISDERFQKYRISYSDFCQNPALIDNPRLVLRIHNKYYNWVTAAPIVLCMQAFNQELPQGVIDQLTQQRMPPQSRGWWFSWRRRSLPNQPQASNPTDFVEQNKDPVLSRSEEKVEVAAEPSAVPVQPCTYQKSLRLTSEQIRSLNLQSGANEVVFSVCTKFQGTCRTRAQIYLWDSTDRIIVSDIDGTVTRSDALGHILPQLGKDWTQPGIVQLYNAIHKNGYKFLYCSARSVGLADITKTFLQGVSEGGYSLPPGPLLLSPSSLFTALHREVIEKTPEHFKIACLSDICQLFADPSPFHAAFGNRPNDVLAYREVGVPESRIFTVNPRGELTQDLNSGFKSSYSAMCDVVNVMFSPPSSLYTPALLSPQFNDFSYWRDPVSSISDDELVDIS